MKMNGNEIRQGNIIKHQDTLWVAVKCNAVKPGKGGAFNQVELKNLLDGRKLIVPSPSLCPNKSFWKLKKRNLSLKAKPLRTLSNRQRFQMAHAQLCRLS